MHNATEWRSFQVSSYVLTLWIPFTSTRPLLRGRTVRYAVVGYLDPFPMAEVTGVTAVFPDTGLLGFLLSPKNPIMS